MPEVERYSFTTAGIGLGEASLTPLLPITLATPNASVQAHGLVDSGAAVNVLPFQLGIQLGVRWEPEMATIKLGGNLAGFEACPLVVTATVGGFAPVRLAFAWTRAENVPLLLGQVNFFMEFDVCFYRSRRTFDIRIKS